ncbi:hypothetical protein ACDW_44830 (plasmid) [Acidovorax sp. DW039]|uniref:hypothetical protein n=1 Tax=Acidovorax sp. DW039 TaxID=3095606 RepID=UPI003090C81E|nr:hypothetical protein ACDW_44830 [Acidovorax sp. DW039]
MAAELTYQERLNRFEIAQETIGFMMAMHTRSIDQEQKKAAPDTAVIDSLRAEFKKLADELYYLRLKDDATIQRVLDEYCPIVKAAYEQERAAS